MSKKSNIISTGIAAVTGFVAGTVLGKNSKEVNKMTDNVHDYASKALKKVSDVTGQGAKDLKDIIDEGKQKAQEASKAANKSVTETVDNLRKKTDIDDKIVDTVKKAGEEVDDMVQDTIKKVSKEAAPIVKEVKSKIKEVKKTVAKK